MLCLTGEELTVSTTGNPIGVFTGEMNVLDFVFSFASPNDRDGLFVNGNHTIRADCLVTFELREYSGWGVAEHELPKQGLNLCAGFRRCTRRKNPLTQSLRFV